MIVHQTRRFPGISNHFTGRHNDGIACCGQCSDGLAYRVHPGRIKGRQMSKNLLFQKNCPDIQIDSGLVQKKVAHRAGRIPADGEKGKEGDQQERRENLPY